MATTRGDNVDIDAAATWPWLSALWREANRDDLTDAIVIHALRLVAARHGADALAQGDYAETRG